MASRCRLGLSPHTELSHNKAAGFLEPVTQERKVKAAKWCRTWSQRSPLISASVLLAPSHAGAIRGGHSFTGSGHQEVPTISMLFLECIASLLKTPCRLRGLLSSVLLFRHTPHFIPPSVVTCQDPFTFQVIIPGLLPCCQHSHLPSKAIFKSILLFKIVIDFKEREKCQFVVLLTCAFIG